jgi:hypothetical protein
MSAPVCVGCWVDPSDPMVISAVVEGCADPDYVPPDPPDDTVALSIQVASELLTRLSGYQIHPAGTAVEDFRAAPRVHRLTPNFMPLKEIIGVARLLPDCSESPVDITGWCISGHSVYFNPVHCDLGSWYIDACTCAPVNGEALRLTYAFGSTVTASAQRAVLYLARQLWLECHPGQGECELPERVTSVNREGLSYTIFDPMTFLDQGRTGLPRVDLWLASVNPSKAKRRSAVYTPDAPPAVNRTFIMAVVP